MKKKCEIVMIATKKATWPNCIWLGRSLGMLHLDKSYNSHYSCDPIDESMLPQHLYITSDEEIKKGDWVFNPVYKTVYQRIQNADIKFDIMKAKKIIATTDLSLSTILQPHIDKYGDLRYSSFSELPKPSESFIKKYIREYNSGNQITEVMVEYDIFDEPTIDGDWERYREYKLKVSNKNEVIITKIKDSWSREEVEGMLADFLTDCWNKNYQFDGLSHDEIAIKWLKQNL